jgi:hypothetical protein
MPNARLGSHLFQQRLQVALAVDALAHNVLPTKLVPT